MAIGEHSSYAGVMSDETTKTPRGHDLSVAYCDVLVPGPELIPIDWDAWTEADEDEIHYYVKGPCPGCQATVQGHAVDKATGPMQAQGSKTAERRPSRSHSIEVPVSCTCGFGHGNNLANNCGRRWLLELTRDER
jgi:hypothetical protein